MYLYLRKYENCGSWTENFEEKKKDFYPPELKSFQEEIEKRNFLSKSAIYQVGYWRKANAIHNWFVQNCAEGVDDCKLVYLEVEDAKKLKDTISKILDNHKLAKTLLPTKTGFFFGSEEYDDWYFNSLKYTKDLLEKVISFVENDDSYSICYQASW